MARPGRFERPTSGSGSKNRSHGKRIAAAADCRRSVRSLQSAERLPRVGVPRRNWSAPTDGQFQCAGNPADVEESRNALAWMACDASRFGVEDFYIKARPEKTVEAMTNLEKEFREGQEAFEKKAKAS